MSQRKPEESFMNQTKRSAASKKLAVLLSVALIITSIPPKTVEALWFSDFFGGLFTVITAPIWVFCSDNPTFRKNNPFRKKAWQENPDFFPQNKYQEEKKPERLPSHLPEINLPKPPIADTDSTESDSFSSSHKSGQRKSEIPDNENEEEKSTKRHITKDNARFVFVDHFNKVVETPSSFLKRFSNAFLDMTEMIFKDFVVSQVSGIYAVLKKVKTEELATKLWVTTERDESVSNYEIAKKFKEVEGELNELFPPDSVTAFGFSIWNSEFTSRSIVDPSFTIKTFHPLIDTINHAERIYTYDEINAIEEQQ
jgi:hypothetical protein